MSVANDVRFAVRSFSRRPGLTAVLVLTGGLAIGACTALFDLANLIAWLPIPGTSAERLVRVYTAHPQPFVGDFGFVPPADWEVYARESESFEAVTAALRSETLTARPADEVGDSRGHAFAERPVRIDFVAGNFFEVLRVEAERGRLLRPDDDRGAAPAAAVVSHSLWRSALASDPDLVGSTLLLADRPVEIVGVAAPEFSALIAGNRTDLWLADAVGERFIEGYAEMPLAPASDMLATLRPGVSIEQARAELQNLAGELDRVNPLPTISRRITVVPARFSHDLDQRNFRPILEMLGISVLLLLVLASANIANLLLGRSIDRSREISVRLALGAGRRRLVRQLLSESLLLALVAGGVGLLLAVAGRSLFALWNLEELARSMRFDHRVLLASLATCVVASLLFGLVPALAASRSDLAGAFRGGAGSVSRRSLRAFEGLAGLQVALATLLLVCTAVVSWNLWSLRSSELGFDDTGLVRASFDLGSHGYSPEEARRFMVRLEEAVAGEPGVVSTSRALFMPPVFLDVERKFHRPDDPDTQRSARFNVVDEGYFETLGVPVLHGRVFDSRDESGPPSVILNEMLARRIWPEEDPADVIGRTLLHPQRRPTDPEPEHRVIGIVGTIRQHDLRSEGEPILYLSIDQRPQPPYLSLVARTEGDPEAYVETLRARAAELDPRVLPDPVTTAAELRWEALVVQRLQSQSVAFLAIVGLFLGLIGVFGVMQLVVARRRREIGVRMAVGASGRGIVRWVLARSGRLTLAGVAVGLLAAVPGMRLLERWIEGLPPVPLWIPAAVAAVVLVGTTLAVLTPASRAARTRPSEVLRSE